MPALNGLDCRTKKKINVYALTPFIFNESSPNINISDFEKVNVIQMNIKKIDNQLSN